MQIQTHFQAMVWNEVYVNLMKAVLDECTETTEKNQ